MKESKTKILVHLALQEKMVKDQKINKFYIKPYTVLNYNEKQLFTLRPRNAAYTINNGSTISNQKIGYLLLKITPVVEEKGTNVGKEAIV